MIRKLAYCTGFLLLMMAASCEFERCKICKQVVYQNGNVIDEKNEAKFCGAELIRIEAMPPATVGNLTTQWECR